MRLVSNSSPLIALAKLGLLRLLGDEVVIPGAVFSKELYDHALALAHER